MFLKCLSVIFIVLCVSETYAIQVIRDIPYTHDGRQALDLLMPVETRSFIPPRPAAIVMHSGGWVGGCRSEIENIAEWFAEQGLVVINVDYTLATATENKWPAQVADVIQGVWWLKENAVRYNINPNKILAVGASAGGHLAAMLGQTSISNLITGVDSEVHGIVVFSAPWNLLTATTDKQLYYTGLLLPAATPEALYMASPVYRITRHSPPVLIFHGTDDELVPFQQSEEACEAYVSKGMNYCFLVPLEGCTHALELTDIEKTFDSIRQFLDWWLTQ
ncbi:MAG: alpha/beta hydrolase fold domain-containing protein [Methyloprofundus sp.]|nr:alpha/beta hydrolase fold domain-containing protein [Methyloprofundus sp.]